MKLSEGQTRPLWKLLAEAWAVHCRQTGERIGDSKAKEAWRRALLLAETGFDSITKIPRAGKAYVTFMAALEVIAGNGIRWQMALHGAEKRPYIHGITTVINAYDLSYEYVREIWQRVSGTGTEPDPEKMGVEQLAAFLGALKRTCKYKLTRTAAFGEGEGISCGTAEKGTCA